MLVANCSRFEKIIGVFFCLSLWDVLLNVLIKANCLVQIDCLEVIEVDVIVYFGQLLQLIF